MKKCKYQIEVGQMAMHKGVAPRTLFVCDKLSMLLGFRCSFDEATCSECVSLGEESLPVEDTEKLKEIFIGAVRARLIPSFSKEIEKTVPADIGKLFALYSAMCKDGDKKSLVIDMLNHATRLHDNGETDNVVSRIADMLIASGEQRLIEEIVAEPRRNNI